MQKTVEELKWEDVSSLVKKVLEEEYLFLSIKKLTLIEECEKEISQINCRLSENDGKVISLKSTGDGILDALFKGLLRHYDKRYRSLKTIAFQGFNVVPDFSKGGKSGSDASVEVVIRFTNSLNSVITFRNRGKSFVSASVRGVLAAIEFYINAEKAFRKLKVLIEDADSRNRSDIAQRYLSKITTIVKVTSYEDI